MSAIENGTKRADDETRPREQAPPTLVWDQINAWVWASRCGRFKLERFIVGEHEGIIDSYQWPERYRVLKRNPEWYFQFSTEPTLAAAQAACERLVA